MGLLVDLVTWLRGAAFVAAGVFLVLLWLETDEGPPEGVVFLVVEDVELEPLEEAEPVRLVDEPARGRAWTGSRGRAELAREPRPPVPLGDVGA